MSNLVSRIAIRSEWSSGIFDPPTFKSHTYSVMLPNLGDGRLSVVPRVIDGSGIATETTINL